MEFIIQVAKKIKPFKSCWSYSYFFYTNYAQPLPTNKIIEVSVSATCTNVNGRPFSLTLQDHEKIGFLSEGGSPYRNITCWVSTFSKDPSQNIQYELWKTIAYMDFNSLILKHFLYIGWTYIYLLSESYHIRCRQLTCTYFLKII